jgi:hypothetical protein
MNSWEGKDRRSSPELRIVFERAYVLIEPFLDPDSAWGGQAMQHLALRTVRDNFPELSMDQAHILVVAALRVRRERR